MNKVAPNVVRTTLLALALLLVPASAQEGQQDRPPGPTDPQELTTIPNSAEDVARPSGEGGLTDASFALVKVADGFQDPVNVVAAPDDSGRLFVVERSGRIRIVQDGEVRDEPFVDISDQVLDAFLEQGLYDVAFHPDFASNGKVYLHFAELLRNGDSVIVEYRLSQGDANKLDPESARLILQIDQPWANHNGGELAFGPDGYLYIGSGDGGWEGDPLGAGQDLSTLLGKILRIDVNVPEGVNERYLVPADNPFATQEGLVRLFGLGEDFFAGLHTEAKPEIFAYGLRNPWKFNFDPENGDMYIAEVGQNHWEEVDLLPAGAKGLNYGWDFLMGTKCFPLNQEGCAQVGVLPIAEYPHEDGNCAVIGIGVSRGGRLPGLEGAYLFGDYCSGKIWATARAGDGDTWRMQEIHDTALLLTGAGEDAEGNLYVTSCNCNYGGPGAAENAPGTLWRLVSADQVPDGAETAATAGGEGQEGEEAPKPEGGDGGQQEGGQQEGGQEDQAQQDQAQQDQAGGGQQGQALAQQGEQVYRNNCVSCHGAEGGGGVGPALAGNQGLSEVQAVVNQIAHGGGGMPAFGDRLTPEQIAAVASYIRTAWGNSFGEVTPQNVQEILGQ